MNLPKSAAELEQRSFLRMLPGFSGRAEKSLAKSLFVPRRSGYACELESRWLQTATVIRLRNGIVARSWGEGPKVLLVHGWNARGTQLCSYIEPLVRRGYEVVAIDLPGHGDSAGKFLTPIKARDTLLDVGQELGELHSVVAHGYGACAALWALSHGLVAGKLVVLAGWSDFMWKEYMAISRLSQRSLAVLEQQLEKVLKHSPAQWSVEHFAEKITAPVLLVHGKGDSEVSLEHFERNRRVLPTARMKLLDGLNHMDVLYEPKAVKVVMSFVTEDYDLLAA